MDQRRIQLNLLCDLTFTTDLVPERERGEKLTLLQGNMDPIH
jgi:hypothetical protein